MPDVSEFSIYSSDEFVDRAWADVSQRLPGLDRNTRPTVELAFRAGWQACIVKLIEAENRKDGIG